MDTPRRGLIRATESAIKEYIQEGCVDNLPMIRKLEDAAYHIWVESNTSFLNESVVTVEDEDEWIWDEDYLYQSFSANTDGNLTDLADDTSSICSSIKPCDETDCSFGYLASCEDNDSEYMDISAISAGWETPDTECGTDSAGVHVNVRTDCGVEYSERDGLDKSTLSSADHRKMKNHENWNIVRETSTKNDTFRENHEVENCDANLREPLDKNEDEWVIVNEDLSESVLNNDWFIPSVNQTNQCNLGTPRRRKSTPVDIHPEQLGKDLTDSEKDETIPFDLSDWAVLSVKITEWRGGSEDQTVKQSKDTKKCCTHDLSSETKMDLPKGLIRETFGLESQATYEISSVNSCPLCKKRQDSYKCAIFCLLMQ